ncbi:hypothetical protein DFQ12_2656 [Sphingobacterium detergens]|uniref:Uncharacterized protein n=2 Tax=Sphingobacterium detergens TaxID=1145106 RepID=A0A420B6K6_SPHD1|nr:hypothetical protein DFQ12_2656 [Sphingobacterium detergens]
MKILPFSFLVLMCLVMLGNSFAQQNSTLDAANKYMEHKTYDIEKYLNRSQRIQKHLLRVLKKKEVQIRQKLAAKDSLLYRQFTSMNLTYDSIARLLHDTTSLVHRGNSRNTTIDSLKGLQRFIQQQAAKLSDAKSLVGQSLPDEDYTAKLSELQSRLNAEGQVKELIQMRTQSLEQLVGKVDIPGLQAIQKQVYYSQEKMKAWRDLADDPDAAEEKALEYLQGIEGFENNIINKNLAFGGLGVSATAADLQSIGYQTKDQMKGILQTKFGGNLQAVQQRMGEQIQQFSEKLNGVKDKVTEAKQAAIEARQGLNKAKAFKEKLTQIEKPAFKKNPERGKPFWQRLETQYNFQTARTTPDGLRPAMLEFGASIAFKHTPKLSYGIGMATSIGLGKNWQNIKFSYEGISARAYADWLVMYGISVQVGYEQIFRPLNRPYLKDQADPNKPQSQHSDNAWRSAFGNLQHLGYAGLMKRYHINDKWSGTFLIGYNFLWQQYNLRTPFMIRLGLGK